MRRFKHSRQTLLACSLLGCGLLASCKGGGSSSGDPTPEPPVTPPTLQQRIDAANHTASNIADCSTITPFYWEIGDRNGVLASGTGGDNSALPPAATTPMLIASASKWLFATYVVQKKKGLLSDPDIAFLHFTSGYSNFSACSLLSTVDSCLDESGLSGGNNGDHVTATDGHFFYNGGHMQVMASTLGLGDDHNAELASDIQSEIGAEVALGYIEPQLAGGGLTSAANYGQFLRNMLDGHYAFMNADLGQHAVCTHTNSTDCPAAIYSPVNQSRPPKTGVSVTNDINDERWHYSLGHWVEDDPIVGDGAFSSPGRFGFYPWIDKTKTYYGILARYDPVHVGAIDPKTAAYITSAYCGRLIRKAWQEGKVP